MVDERARYEPGTATAAACRPEVECPGWRAWRRRGRAHAVRGTGFDRCFLGRGGRRFGGAGRLALGGLSRVGRAARAAGARSGWWPATGPAVGWRRSWPGSPGAEALRELRRQADRIRLRGSAVAPGWRRLDRAAAVLNSLALRPGGPGETAVLEAAVAERDCGSWPSGRPGSSAGCAYGGSHESLGQALSALVAQFEQGVTAYEELVGAAAAYVAEDGRTTREHPSVSQLTEATDLLRGIALGFAELRQDDRLTA